ncbi:beta-ketoacyl synthase N-terminal-like domain-containing protein [Winogradskyella poriferorum]|uniref:beta-ketoacyl synthase N-terminal-like domain-containing protein n=1 Tax=Winogradskyella poriferorum TaxID=307627 RepID=UPI003D65113B
MLKNPISITAMASISPLGIDPDEIWENYNSNKHFFTKQKEEWVSKLPESSESKIESLSQSNSKYRQLDKTVLYGIFAARQAVKNANWSSSDDFGVNIGSSRGATELFEQYYTDFFTQKNVSVLSSPTTTLGNISSWIAHDLQTQGPTISHSITCSTALHAMLNGIAWLHAGMSDKFLVGGSEAPLTDFTIAQMKALKIYAQGDDSWPCKSLDFSKTENTMILGEGAAMLCLENGTKQNAIAVIKGIGYGTETLKHNVSLSTNAVCFQRSMKMALGQIDTSDIDVIITHTPGTIKGDIAELNAIKKVFGDRIPALTTNKTLIGHSLGASGTLSIEMAILMLKHQKFIEATHLKQESPDRISNILINAVGFGGNAVSLVISL